MVIRVACSTGSVVAVTWFAAIGLAGAKSSTRRSMDAVGATAIAAAFAKMMIVLM